MEVPILEEWEADLWSVIENTLRRAGGTLATTGSESGTLGGCLTSKGFSAKVKAKWGTFARFLERHDGRFSFSVDGKKMLSLRDVDERTATIGVAVRPVTPSAVNVGSANVDREEGVVVRLKGRGMFIRATSQSLDCADRDLYFASFSHLRNKSEEASIRLGVSVSFAKSRLKPNPNPYCSDVFLVNIDSMNSNFTEGNDNNVIHAVQTNARFKFVPDEESSTEITIEVDVEFEKLLECLPPRIAEILKERVDDAESQLMDVVMDLERPVCFVRSDGPDVRDENCIVGEDDISFVMSKCGKPTDSNRACVGSSLHRCSVIRDPHTDDIIGLTLRMARSVRGLADVIKDVIGVGKSVLLIGPPGLGKTTLLRDVAFTLASEAHGRRVMVVDTNNEIAGEHTLPHRAIGHARRMKVGLRSQQYRRMLEAFQNHTPQTLIIDEIGTKQEVTEAVGVKQRGVQLIATTHGRTLRDVILNPHLRDLLGGVNTVILSAQEREQEQAASKTRNERKMEPAFDVCIELIGLNKWRIHHDIAASVDVVLRRSGRVFVEVRQLMSDNGRVVKTRESFSSTEHVPSVFESASDE